LAAPAVAKIDSATPQRYSLGEIALCAIAVGTVLIAVWFSWRWPLMLDGPLMQYCAFLMEHGKVPYRDIVDVNGMGAYVSSLVEHRLFGYSDLGWRIYDLLIGLVGSLGIFLILKPFGRVAWIFGSCLFLLLHIQLGAKELGQRDFQMAAFELLSAGLLLRGSYSRHWGWFAASGAAGVFGAMIKPPAFLFVLVFFLFAVFFSFRCGNRKFFGPLWLLAGAAVPFGLGALYLLWNGAGPAFAHAYRNFVPLYGRIAHFGLSELWPVPFTHIGSLRLLIVLSGFLLASDRATLFRRESALVLIGIACGLACFLVQAKGWTYHMEPWFAFVAVWCGMAIGVLLKDTRILVRLPVALVLAIWLVIWMPTFVRHTRAGRYDLTNTHRLEAEILKLRSAGKDHGIQVMDMSTGGILALYDLRLVQETGFLYDYYFYQSPQNPLVQELRQRFLDEMGAKKPDILVVSFQSWPDPQPGYGRVDQWPGLRDLLQSDYELKQSIAAYRIYVHR